MQRGSIDVPIIYQLQIHWSDWQILWLEANPLNSAGRVQNNSVRLDGQA